MSEKQHEPFCQCDRCQIDADYCPPSWFRLVNPANISGASLDDEIPPEVLAEIFMMDDILEQERLDREARERKAIEEGDPRFLLYTSEATIEKASKNLSLRKEAKLLAKKIKMLSPEEQEDFETIGARIVNDCNRTDEIPVVKKQDDAKIDLDMVMSVIEEDLAKEAELKAAMDVDKKEETKNTIKLIIPVVTLDKHGKLKETTTTMEVLVEKKPSAATAKARKGKTPQKKVKPTEISKENVVTCLPCPHAEINIPTSKEQAENNENFLYIVDSL